MMMEEGKNLSYLSVSQTQETSKLFKQASPHGSSEIQEWFCFANNHSTHFDLLHLFVLQALTPQTHKPLCIFIFRVWGFFFSRNQVNNICPVFVQEMTRNCFSTIIFKPSLSPTQQQSYLETHTRTLTRSRCTASISGASTLFFPCPSQQPVLSTLRLQKNHNSSVHCQRRRETGHRLPAVLKREKQLKTCKWGIMKLSHFSETKAAQPTSVSTCQCRRCSQCLVCCGQKNNTDATDGWMNRWRDEAEGRYGGMGNEMSDRQIHAEPGEVWKSPSWGPHCTPRELLRRLWGDASREAIYWVNSAVVCPATFSTHLHHWQRD